MWENCVGGKIHHKISVAKNEICSIETLLHIIACFYSMNLTDRVTSPEPRNLQSTRDICQQPLHWCLHLQGCSHWHSDGCHFDSSRSVPAHGMCFYEIVLLCIRLYHEEKILMCISRYRHCLASPAIIEVQPLIEYVS